MKLIGFPASPNTWKVRAVAALAVQAGGGPAVHRCGGVMLNPPSS